MTKKRLLFTLLFAFCFSVLVFPVQAANQNVLVLNIDGVINPLTARYLDRGIELADRSDSALLVITLDTPGGLESSMREMVQAILQSSVPVAVFVAPAGARATSAGLFLLMAADIAAMAPATNVGAATPVLLDGEMDAVMNEKSLSDASALIRGLAEQRGRNIAWAEAAVRDSLSLSASEALNENVIDLIADDLNDLLGQLDGRTVENLTLDLSEAVVTTESMNWVEKFFHIITNPNIAYLLLSLGALFLLAELADPGLSFAGIGAVVSFVIGFMALGSLPVNWAAIGLLIISLILFVVALLTDTEVIVTAAGLIPFVLGSLLLFSPFRPGSPLMPELRVSVWLIILMAGLIVLFSLVILRAIVKASKLPPQAGAQRYIGHEAVAISDLSPDGQVEIEGQAWSAVSNAGDVKKGRLVRVMEVSGVRLIVTPLGEGEKK